jgi:hypothetical protein
MPWGFFRAQSVAVPAPVLCLILSNVSQPSAIAARISDLGIFKQGQMIGSGKFNLYFKETEK